jgi:hypothetical protein
LIQRLTRGSFFAIVSALQRLDGAAIANVAEDLCPNVGASPASSLDTTGNRLNGQFSSDTFLRRRKMGSELNSLANAALSSSRRLSDSSSSSPILFTGRLATLEGGSEASVSGNPLRIARHSHFGCGTGRNDLRTNLPLLLEINCGSVGTSFFRSSTTEYIRSAGRLLNAMSEFMRQQSIDLIGPGRILARSENNVIADGIRKRSYR